MELSERLVTNRFNISTLHVDRHMESGRGDKVALIYDRKEITYRELLSLVNKAGNALAALGVEIEDRVMVSLRDSPEAIAFFLGAMRIGAIPFMIHPSSSSDDFKYYLSDSRAKVALVERDDAETIELIRGELRYLKEVLIRGDNMGSALDKASEELDPADTSKDDVAYWVYTSGTSGRPKAAVHLHHDLVYSVSRYVRHVINASHEDLFYSTSKLTFSYGRVNSMHMPLMLGATVLLDEAKPSPERVIDILENRGVTIFFSVPTFYVRLVNYIQSSKLSPRFPSLRLCVSGGEPLTMTVYRKWVELTGREILNGLGSSEAEYIYISNVPGRIRGDSIAGGEVIPGWEWRLVDEDGKEVREPWRLGVLWIKSDSLATQYWNRHEESKEVFVGEWYNTKDMLYMDEHGFLYYVGRSDDVFKVKGMWVIPSEIEDALLSHPAVAECAVVGQIDDADGLVKPKAYIVLKEGYEPSENLKDDITEHLLRRLQPYKVPKYMEFVDEIPKTPTGKVQRYKLRTRHERLAN